jgi:levanase/fructan beta-fructosidase
MSWGHATSEDLIHWVEHPVAIPEDSNANEAIFSGSAVFDEQGTAGEEGSIVACYTSHVEQGESKKQYQSIAISTDGGYTFAKQGSVLDRNLRDFRDPKVFRYQDHWLMVVVHPADQKVEILRSDDLRNWESLSFFGYPMDGDVIWECPDLFQLKLNGDAYWVLIISVNPGGPKNGSGTLYFVGEFDGKTFTASQPPQWLEFGRDNYAGVTFNQAPNGERILIGWMNSWGKTPHPDLPWTGAMTIPRKLRLVSMQGSIWLAQEPVMAPQYKITLSATNNFTSVLPHGISVDYQTDTGTLSILSYEADVGQQQELVLEVLEDSCSLEVFAMNGTRVFSFLVFS